MQPICLRPPPMMWKARCHMCATTGDSKRSFVVGGAWIPGCATPALCTVTPFIRDYIGQRFVKTQSH